jgi:hypothetical protein
MSYQLTTIAQYGVRLSGDEARSVFLEASASQFRSELACEAEDIYEEWDRTYVGTWLDIELEHHASEPVAFFSKYKFCQRLVPAERMEITLLGEHRGTALRRYRYHSDFRCDDASRRDDRLYAPGVEHHFFGIYLASDGYAYRDDLDAFTRPPRRMAIDNFTDFCAPVLLRLGIAPAPALHVFEQIW